MIINVLYCKQLLFVNIEADGSSEQFLKSIIGYIRLILEVKLEVNLCLLEAKVGTPQ